jgi:hypothetical protein
MSNSRFSIMQARAVGDERVSDAQFRTLAALGCYGDEEGWCFPSLKTIGKKLHKSPQAVSKDIIKLVEVGYLEKHPRFNKDGGRRSNLYRLRYDLPPSTLEVDTPSTPKIDTPSTSEVEVNVPVNDPSNVKEGATPATPTPPEIALYRTVTKKFPPSPNNEDVIAFVRGVSARLGREVVAEDLRPFYKAWTANGWNQFSINWLEYAVKGVLPSTKKSTFNVGDALRSMMQEEPAYGNA